MLISPQRAIRIVLELVHPLQKLSIALGDALGSCLSKPVRADRDHPPTDRSAMDGFALRDGDVRGGRRRFRLIGEVAAGSGSRPRVRPGTCARILTGAMVPPGADTVVRVEDTAEADGVVTIVDPPRPGANIRRRGEETRRGDVVIPSGTVLGAAEIGVCAAMGAATVGVYRRPSVTILCTGRELKGVDQLVRPHELRDSNGPSLQAALQEAGLSQVRQRIVPDDPRRLLTQLKRACEQSDVVLLSGGVSVGKYDFVPAAVAAIGATVHYHGVRMKPGKPQLYATLSGNRHVFGLPGNPLSVLVGFHEFVLPALRRLSGWSVAACRPATRLPLTKRVSFAGKRDQYALGRLVSRRRHLHVEPVPYQGSADLIAAVQADGVFILPAKTTDARAGDLVEFRSWRNVL